MKKFVVLALSLSVITLGVSYLSAAQTQTSEYIAIEQYGDFGMKTAA